MTHDRLESITAALQPEWERRKHGRDAGTHPNGVGATDGNPTQDFRHTDDIARSNRVTPADAFERICARCPYYHAAISENVRPYRPSQSGRLDFVTAGRDLQKNRTARRGSHHLQNGRGVMREIRHYVRMFGRYGGFVAIPLALLIAVW